MKNFRLKSALIITFMAIQGCSAFKPQITADAVDFNRAVENTNNQVAFLNVIRSYKRHPRHYTSISDIKGNFTLNAAASVTGTASIGDTKVTTRDGAGSSAAAIGEVATNAADTITPTLSAAYTTNPNYTIAILESKGFYNGILKPISPNTLALFRSQGWNSQLLIHLVFEHIEFILSDDIVGKDGKTKTVTARYQIKNDPLEPGWIEYASKLSIQVDPIPPKESVVLVSSSLTPEGVAKITEQNLSSRKCKNSDRAKTGCRPGADYLIYKSIPQATGLKVFRGSALTPVSEQYLKNSYLTGDRSLIERYISKCSIAAGLGSRTFLFSDTWSKSNIVEEKGGGLDKLCKPELHISTRSPDGVVYYVGEYLRALDAGQSLQSTLGVNPHEILIGNSRSPLFRSSLDRPESAFLSTRFNNETFYIATDNSSGRSMQVLGFIQQLVNLNKDTEDLPKTQLIQVQ